MNSNLRRINENILFIVNKLNKKLENEKIVIILKYLINIENLNLFIKLICLDCLLFE